MESLGHIIFKRVTPKSDVSVLAIEGLARNLKMLLLAIDGRSSVAQFANFLPAFAPLSEKFAELERLGYIVRVSRGASDLALASPVPTISAASFESELHVISAELMKHQDRVQTVIANKSEDDFWQGTLARHENYSAAVTLEDLLQEMRRFLATVKCLVGLPASLVLEHITTLDQLEQELPAYFELLQSYDINPNEHIENLSRLWIAAKS